MPADPPCDLTFRPDTYPVGPGGIDYPNIAEAPMFGGGYYLPDQRPGEIEIAGIALGSTTGDVFSIRARRTPTGRLSYRVVDEYGTKIEVRRHVRGEPLSMGELVDLIDALDIGLGEGLVTSLLDDNWGDGEAYDSPDALRNFVVVLSDLYPELEEYYDQRVAAWVEAHRTVPGGAPRQQDLG